MFALSDPLEVADVPEARRRFTERSEEWIAEKQRKGRYEGRNGYEALRFLTLAAELARVGPERVREEHVWRILGSVGGERRPKTLRFYAGILDNFLTWCGNPVVSVSGIRSQFPNRAVSTPVIPGPDRDRVLNAALGQERIVTALLGVGRRKIEIVRARVGDFRLDEVPPIYSVRQKGGRGQVTDTFVLTPMILRELAWYLPLRSQRSSGARDDTGHLLCREEGSRLVGVSTAYVDRLLHSAERRAGVAPWPAHSFRRGAATLLRARGADWEDVSMALGHRSPETTRLYVEPLVRQGRVAQALQLLEPLAQGRKA